MEAEAPAPAEQGNDNKALHDGATWVDAGWKQPNFGAELRSREVEEATSRERIQGLFQLNYYGLSATTVVALLSTLALSLRGILWALPWCVLMLLIVAVRWWVCRRFFAQPAAFEALSGWARRAVLMSAVQGSAWALLVPIGWSSGNPYDFAGVMFIAAGFSFGALATLAAHLPAYLAFTTPIYLASGLIFLLERSVTGALLALVVGVFGLMTANAAGVSTGLLLSSLAARHQNRALIRTLSEENERVQVTLGSIGEAVFATDPEGLLTYLNPHAETLTGWSLAEARGQRLAEVFRLLNETSREPVGDLVADCLAHDGPLSPDGEVALLDRSGDREYSVEVSVSPIRDYERRIRGVVIVAHDVTDLRHMARMMSYQANHDPLTGLVNRREFERRLREALDEANHGGREHALCYVDLDQFKVVNDTCGHMAGDQLLTRLSAVLRQHVRDCDTLARLGGDEFGLLLKNCDLELAGALASELLEVISGFRFSWDDKVFQLGASIGVAAIHRGSTPTQVLAAADSACYVAKDEGRNRVHIVYPDDEEVSSRHGQMRLVSEIHRALEEDRFQLRYQRIESLKTPGRSHAEILLSMQAEDGSVLAPGQFLPAAERYSMMAGVDRWVVSRAFRQLQHSPVLQQVEQLAINLSGQSLSSEQFAFFVAEELERSGVDARRICFEITETAAIANLARAQEFIRTLRARGCRFALDDFGSGLSSFAYLRSLPVDYLKIDGAFVRNMSKDAIDRAMVVSINEVGHVMGIETIAEFVEDAATRELLRELGVDYVQGYGIHKPEPLP
ncbi:EAL domain-containing protein [Alkalilimnicola sp. S0819]|uniref:EAL domain-containing protein n=1 Tax=Alkalilimnicola sp. S0819 TaxID=2613922 RepID=UPI0012615653|nr:EAL domain-containing protein [Alkalilimnicola sp. S0819]KAB7622983.1 EAL domain-containing protein [Alkalilimnicola sp. S0819]MPQ17092.1 EAL domain-containing protein [Alkalilimnicola sp. S0819]